MPTGQDAHSTDFVPEENIEDSEDFKYFLQNTMNKEVERLLPLEEQLRQKRKEEELALQEQIQLEEKEQLL